MTQPQNLFQGQDRAPVEDTAIPSGDYKVNDPGPFIVDCRGGRSLEIDVKCSANTGGGGVTVTLEGYDPGDNSWFTLLASVLITSTTRVRLQISPDLAASANVIAKDLLPARVRVTPVGSGTRTTLTYSISAKLTL